MHPDGAEAIEWDDGNETELRGHSISPRDVEDVFMDRPIWVPNKRERSGDWLMLGRNRGGRRLTVVVKWDEVRRVLRPITGWDTSQGERTKYFHD